jgi:alkylresorcinol/alkylpyrone synthase
MAGRPAHRRGDQTHPLDQRAVPGRWTQSERTGVIVKSVSFPRLTSIASAFPATLSQSDLWDHYFAAKTSGVRWARQVFHGTGVSSRHLAVDPTVEDPSSWSTGRRMQRYLSEAMPLAKDAAGRALGSSGLSAEDLGLLVVTSCTGYVSPGVDLGLARDLGCSDGLQRLVVGHMGCFAALPALAAATDHVAARGKAALVVCVELCSLHAQPVIADLEQVTAHALFSDAATALVVEPGGASSGLEVLEVASRTDAGAAALMTWDVTDLGFRMGLARQVPDVLSRRVGDLVDDLLRSHGMVRQDVAGWAVHPGGPRILDVVGDRLGLPEGALAASRRVLDTHGNCSSATLPVVVEEVCREGLEDGAPVVLLAFGPGLTLYGALCRWRAASGG